MSDNVLGPGLLSRALVTGAAGFIGVHLVERLVASGAEVVGIDNERSGDWSRLVAPCRRIDRNLTEMADAELSDVCRSVDVVFHLAAEKYNSSRSSPQKVIDVNISATNRLFAAAAGAGAKVVFTSSLYSYGSMGPDPMVETALPRPTTDYGMSKVAGEHLLRVAERGAGLRWAVARLFFVYGPRQYAEGGYKSVIVSNFERMRRGERPTIHGDGAQSLDYVYVDDVIDALLALCDVGQDGRLYNIGSGRGVDINALTTEMSRIAGSDLDPIYGLPDWTAGSSRVGDVAAAHEGLGWRSTTAMSDGLERVWRWMVEAGE